MSAQILTSTPLRPLAERLADLSRRSEEIAIASAFVTAGALADLLDQARAGARLRVLTGTFGHTTRRSTFKQLLDATRASRNQVRVWDSGAHRNLHAKLYLWRLPRGRGVGWVGSANLTDGGLQNDGEVVLEISDRWDSDLLRVLRSAFEQEWQRGEPITAAFVDAYNEAPRTPPDARVVRGRRQRSRTGRQTSPPARSFVTSISRHYAENSAASIRIEGRLGGTAYGWFRLRSPVIDALGVGDEGILVDLPARQAAHIRITDAVRDGLARIVAYEPVRAYEPWVGWTSARRARAMKAAGFRARGAALGTRRLAPNAFAALVRELYRSRVRERTTEQVDQTKQCPARQPLPPDCAPYRADRESTSRKYADPPLISTRVEVAPGHFWRPVAYSDLVKRFSNGTYRGNYVLAFVPGGTEAEVRQRGNRLNRGKGQARWAVRYLYNALGCWGYPITLIDGRYRLWAADDNGRLVVRV